MNYRYFFNVRLLVLLGAVLGGLYLVKRYYVLVSEKHSKQSNVLVVGVAAGYAPFVSIDTQGNYEGFDIDMAYELGRVMNKKIVLKDLGSMTALFMALDQGIIDTIMWGISITHERLKKVALVNYQGAATRSYPMLFWKKIPDTITDISDMNNKLVAVEVGSCQHSFLNNYPDISQLPVERVDDALLNMRYGKVDAALVEPAIAKKFKNRYPEIKIIDVPLPLEDQVLGVGIVIKKGNNDLIEQITRAIDHLKSTGLIAKLEQKWGLE